MLPEPVGPSAPRSVLYPVSLDLADRRCLVVGGGALAAEKARGLLEAGARVTVVAPEVDAAIEELAVAIERRPYRPGEAAGYRLVVTTTGDPELDQRVHDDAEAGGAWVNSPDDPQRCSFQLPSIWRAGPVTVAISTAGASPALSQWLRAKVVEALPEEAGVLAELLAEARERLRAGGRPTGSVDWPALLTGPLPELVRQGRLEEARNLLSEVTAWPP